VLCGSGSNAGTCLQGTSCTPLFFEGGDNQLYVDPPPVGDWANEFYKGECAQNEFAAGVSQDVNGVTDGLLCCPAAVTHSACHAQPLDSSVVPNYDCDYGYLKAEGNSGEDVAGSR